MTLKYRVVLEPGEDGWIVATVPAVKGCVSQGKTREEALANIKEALEGILEVRKEMGWSIPEETEVEVDA
ncbi:MAG: type II toxin-antitoxin system HicB family antitoxin [Thermoplasmataceae archaeon]